MRALITQSNYIPWKGYFDTISLSDVFVIYDDMQYTKRDWRNRNKINSPNGLLWLTVPVNVKGKFFQKIIETEIADRNWKNDHWKTIISCYSKAKFFKEYRPYFEELYLGCEESTISKVNYRFLKGICDLLEIKTEFRWSSDFDLRGDKSEKLLNLCLDLKATSYISGPAAKDYLDVSLFNNHDIQVEWCDYSDYPEYEQVFGPFNHGVSILDLIFCTGPNAKNFLKHV